MKDKIREKPAPAVELRERAAEIPNTPFLTGDISSVGHRKRERTFGEVREEFIAYLNALLED